MSPSTTDRSPARRPHRTQSVGVAARKGVSPLPTPHSPLPTTHSPLPTAHCPLPTALCLLLLLAGCPGSEPATQPSDKLPFEGVELRLAVVDDPDLAAAAERLQGEWKKLTGSEFQVLSIGEAELSATDKLPGDAVICPSHLLGPLAERKLIASLPEELSPKTRIPGEDDPFSDVFELVKLREAAWNGEVTAVPFGSPVLICYYRADLLDKLGRRPPQTWAEYQELARLLADHSDFAGDSPPWCGTIEPLAPGWAALTLLARAAPYAKHPSNYSTLFDIETMEPLVAGPPLVRALEELVAAAKAGPPEPLKYDPAAVRTAFWQGRCGMALSWPTAAKGGLSAKVESAKFQVGFAELPGSAEVYDVGRRTWDTRCEGDGGHVPLLAVAGRLGVVTRQSKNGRAAFELLFWLSSDHSTGRVCSASPATTLFSRAHMSSPENRAWVEAPVSPAAAGRYATLTETTLRREQWLFALRIPGRAEYLSSLDAAVARAVRGEQSPGEALREASVEWGEITERLGQQSQQAAYLHSLGI